MIIQLPLTSEPSQNLTVQLGAAKYDIYVRWNDRANVWCLDFTDNITSITFLSGIPLVLGADLFFPYAANIGSLVVNDEDNTGMDAGPDDLGNRIQVYWLSDGLAS